MKFLRVFGFLVGLLSVQASVCAQTWPEALEVVEALELAKDLESANSILDRSIKSVEGLKKVVFFVASSNRIPRHSAVAVLYRLGLSSSQVNEIYEYSQDKIREIKVGHRGLLIFYTLAAGIIPTTVIGGIAGLMGAVGQGAVKAGARDAFEMVLGFSGILGGTVFLFGGGYMFLFEPAQKAYMRTFVESLDQDHPGLPSYKCLRRLVFLSSR